MKTRTTILLAIGAAFVLAGLVVLINAFGNSDAIQQGLWVALFLVVVLVALAGYVILLRGSGTAPSSGALGLPEGSISAVIALILLALFTLSSTYLFVQSRAADGQVRVSTGLSADDVQRLPSDRIVQVDKSGTGDAATYRVSIKEDASTSLELGKTSLATVSTLLVAIVGFYFGQRSTAQGVQQGRDIAVNKGGDPSDGDPPKT